MGTAVLPARRVPLSAWVVAPTALALVTARFAPERVVQHGRRGDDG